MTKDEADDIKRCFDVVAERMETKIAVVAEGHGLLTEKIDQLGAKIDRLDERVDRLAAEMAADRELSKKEHAETRAMIKLSFGQLDDRLTALERGYSDLKARLEIIEKAHAS